MQYGESPSDLDKCHWDIGFIGISVDQRGEKSIEYIRDNSAVTRNIKYIPQEFKVQIDADVIDKDDLPNKLTECHRRRVVIDSTTLHLPEILILLQELKESQVSQISILYVEPGDYKHKQKGGEIINRRDFELSDRVIGFEGIPGHALSLTQDIGQKIVFLCGFEPERFDRAMEDSEIVSANCSCIFGVPAFSPGWEMDSFDNNISIIKERKISGGVNFCGATNPLAVFNKLQDIYRSLSEEEQMFVVPLATRPMNIGACLFLITHPKNRVAVLYDHPTESKGKSISISNWHLFNIQFN